MLNLPGYHSTAAIVAEASEGMYGPNIAYQLSDCTRVVSLDFSDLTDDEAFANDLHKLDTIIDATRALRRGLVAMKKKRDQAASA